MPYKRLCLFSLALILAACQLGPAPLRSGPARQQAGRALHLKFSWPESSPPAAFRTQYLEPAIVTQADLEVSGVGIATPIAPVSPANPVPLERGQSTTAVEFGLIPTGKNRVITVQGRDIDNNLLPERYRIKALVDIAAGVNSATVSQHSTPAAEVVEHLMAASAPEASTLDSIALQEVIDRLLDNATPEPEDDLSPVLINTQALATAIASTGQLPAATPPDRAAYMLTPATLTGTLSGLQESYRLLGVNRTVFPPVKITVNDRASQVLYLPAENISGTVSSRSYTLTGIAPGTHQISFEPAYHTGQSTSMAFAAGASNSINVTFSAGHKQHYFAEARAGDQSVLRYVKDDVLDVLIVKPNNPATQAQGWSEAEHLPLVYQALDQIKHLIPSIQIGTITEVFQNDPNFSVVPMPAQTSGFNANPAASQSPNFLANNGPAPAGNLVGRYDLYINWVTNFCSQNANALGLCQQGYHTSAQDTYVTRIQVATQRCSPAEHIPPDASLAVMTHEILHALGVIGHSNSATDIMFAQTNPAQLLNMSPSKRDINTVRFLYDANASYFNRNHSP